MEKKLRISSTESKRQWTKGGMMIRRELVDPQTRTEGKTLLNFVIVASRMDTPQVGVETKYETKK